MVTQKIVGRIILYFFISLLVSLFCIFIASTILGYVTPLKNERQVQPNQLTGEETLSPSYPYICVAGWKSRPYACSKTELRSHNIRDAHRMYIIGLLFPPTAILHLISVGILTKILYALTLRYKNKEISREIMKKNIFCVIILTILLYIFLFFPSVLIIEKLYN